MFILYPTNVDYLIDSMRILLGDLEGENFSTEILRTSLIGGIKMLQRRWHNRYLVFDNSLVEDPLPLPYYYEGKEVEGGKIAVLSGYVLAHLPDGEGIIPGNLNTHDVFRNPFHTFNSSPDALSESFSPISQEDEYPVTLAATAVLSRAKLVSSSDQLQSWSDGMGLKFSNLSSGNIKQDLYKSMMAELDEYFKKKLVEAQRQSFNYVYG